MKPYLPIICCMATWASAATYTVPEIPVTNLNGDKWTVGISVDINVDTELEAPLSVIAMGAQTGYDEINNNFELILNPDYSFTLNYCTANGTSSNSWNIAGSSVGMAPNGNITESGTYTIHIVGNSFIDGAGVVEFFVAKGAGFGLTSNEQMVIYDFDFSAGFTFSEGTTITTISTDVDTVNGWKVIAVATNGETIPEPTTATLSLLALASLAARRRRK